ncbi:MAG: hypothetical protein MMC33_005827, partial [Icmadophila ericetorum]|nr:hypothetical protein [Icmadophila ericetorum]
DTKRQVFQRREPQRISVLQSGANSFRQGDQESTLTIEVLPLIETPARAGKQPRPLRSAGEVARRCPQNAIVRGIPDQVYTPSHFKMGAWVLQGCYQSCDDYSASISLPGSNLLQDFKDTVLEACKLFKQAKNPAAGQLLDRGFKQVGAIIRSKSPNKILPTLLRVRTIVTPSYPELVLIMHKHFGAMIASINPAHPCNPVFIELYRILSHQTSDLKDIVLFIIQELTSFLEGTIGWSHLDTIRMRCHLLVILGLINDLSPSNQFHCDQNLGPDSPQSNEVLKTLAEQQLRAGYFDAAEESRRLLISWAAVLKSGKRDKLSSRILGHEIVAGAQFELHGFHTVEHNYAAAHALC